MLRASDASKFGSCCLQAEGSPGSLGRRGVGPCSAVIMKIDEKMN